MSLDVSHYTRIGEGTDSVVFRKPGSNSVLKIYDPCIPPRMIKGYHWLHKFYALHEYKPLRPWASVTDLWEEDEEILFQGIRVKGLVCSILSLDPKDVYFGRVSRYEQPRVVSRVKFIEGPSLNQIRDANQSLIKEIEARLRHTGVPIGEGLGLFKIDPMNIKVTNFDKGLLELTVTDLGANISISMAGNTII